MVNNHPLSASVVERTSVEAFHPHPYSIPENETEVKANLNDEFAPFFRYFNGYFDVFVSSRGFEMKLGGAES